MGRGMTVLPEDVGCATADADTRGTRLSHTLLTDPDAAATWDYVSRRVIRKLLKRGCQVSDAQDICQQTGLRAMETHVAYSSPDELVAWCMTVSRNLLVDLHRRAVRQQPVARIPELVGDAEADALAVLGARALLAGVAELSTQDRNALRMDRRPSSRRESNRMAIQRYRARARLTKILGGALAALVAGLRKLPRVAAPASLAVSWAAALALLVSPVPGPAVISSPALEKLPSSVGPNELVSTHKANATAPVTHTRLRASSSGKKRAPDKASTQRTVLKPPGAPQGIYHETRPSTPDDRLLCVDHVPILGHACTPK